MQKCYIILMFYLFHSHLLSNVRVLVADNGTGHQQDKYKDLLQSSTLHRYIYCSGGSSWSVNSKNELCRDH